MSEDETENASEPEAPATEAEAPAPTMDAPAEPAPEAQPSSAPPRWHGLAILGGAALILFVLGPWLFSGTLLPAVVRGQLQQVGPASTVSTVNLSWTEGLNLDRVLVTDGDALLVLLDRVELHTSLLSLAASSLTGDPVESKLLFGTGVVRVGTGEASDDAPAPSAPPPAEDSEPTTLFAALRSQVELGGVDIDLSFSGTRLVFANAVGSGGFEVGKALDVTLTKTTVIRCESFSLASKGETEWSESLYIEKPTITFKVLDVPSGDAKLKLEAELVADSARSGDLQLEAVDLKVSLANGITHLELSAKVPELAGRLHLVLDLDSSKDRAPLKIQVELNDVPIKGELGKSLPVLLPLLHSFRGREGQFPPVSLKAEGGLDLVYGEDGELDRDRSVESIRAKGEVSVAAGRLGTSLLVNGYARALVGLKVSGLVTGVIPKDFAFNGVRAPFTIEGDTVRLEEVVVTGDAVDLALAGQVKFSGDYGFKVEARIHELGTELDAVVRTLNRAGGVSLAGNLEEGTCSGELPSLDALAEAARKEGAVDALLGSPLLEPLKAKLSGGK